MKSSDSKETYCFLGQFSELKGEFNFSGPTHISCFINGKVSMKDKSDIVIEKSGSIEGELYAHNIIIHGEFKGTINALGNLIVRSSAKVSGKLVAKNICIYPGSTVNMEGHTNESLQ